MKNIKRYHQLFESTQELTQEQKDWLDKCTNGTWKVNPRTGLVDVEGDFICVQRKLTDFKGVRFGHVSKDFFCSDNSLTSLEGAPQRVDRTFYCSGNKLTSLKGAPKHVGGHFSCSFNELKSLEGAPQSLSRDFSCAYNNLTSLEGAPQRVGGGFYCSHNELKSLKGAPQHVRVTFDCPRNNLTSLEGIPQSMCRNFSFYNNPISERAIKGVVKRMRDKKISLEQAVAEYWGYIPEDDKIYLAKHHPTLPEKEKRIYRAMELNMKRR